MKFLSLGLIAATATLVSAGTIDVTRTNVVAHNTVSDVLNGAVVADNANSPHVAVLKRKVVADALRRRHMARRYWGDYENENERDENERDENERDENENEADENEPDENERDENENEADEEEEDENEANESSASKVMRRSKMDIEPVDENEEGLEIDAQEEPMRKRFWGGEDEEDEDENEGDENEYEGDENEYEADENEFKRRDLTGGLLNGLPAADLLGTDPDGEGSNSNGILGGVGL